MRGRPLLQWILFGSAWLALALAIAGITSRSPEKESGAHTAIQSVPSSSWLSIRFSSKPESFSIAHKGIVIWPGGQVADTFVEKQIPLSPGADGLELVLSAEFPAAGDVAAELVLEPDGYPAVSRTVWFSGSGSKAVTFSGRRDE